MKTEKQKTNSWYKLYEDIAIAIFCAPLGIIAIHIIIYFVKELFK